MYIQHLWKCTCTTAFVIVFIFVSVYMRIHMHIYICIHICLYILKHSFVSLCTIKCQCSHTCDFNCRSVCLRIYICILTSLFVCLFVCLFISYLYYVLNKTERHSPSHIMKSPGSFGFWAQGVPGSADRALELLAWSWVPIKAMRAMTFCNSGKGFQKLGAPF